MKTHNTGDTLKRIPIVTVKLRDNVDGGGSAHHNSRSLDESTSSKSTLPRKSSLEERAAASVNDTIFHKVTPERHETKDNYTLHVLDAATLDDELDVLKWRKQMAQRPARIAMEDDEDELIKKRRDVRDKSGSLDGFSSTYSRRALHYGSHHNVYEPILSPGRVPHKGTFTNFASVPTAFREGASRSLSEYGEASDDEEIVRTLKDTEVEHHHHGTTKSDVSDLLLRKLSINRSKPDLLHSPRLVVGRNFIPKIEPIITPVVVDNQFKNGSFYAKVKKDLTSEEDLINQRRLMRSSSYQV